MFKRYKPFFRVGAINCFAYKFQIFVWFIITALEFVCTAFLWHGVYQSSPQAIVNGFTFPQMLTYMVFCNVLSFLVAAGDTMDTLNNEIKDGTIASSFTKPVNYRLKALFTMLGSTCAQFLFLALPVATVAYVIFVCIGCIQVVSFWSLLFSIVSFLVAELIAVLIYDCFDYICGVLCFYTTAGWGIAQLKQVLLSFLSGAVIPLSFFPEGLSKVLQYSPFAGLAQNPVLMLLGRLDILQSLKCIGISLVWWVVLELLAAALFSKASKKITVQGG